MNNNIISTKAMQLLHEGAVIPAHPLALDKHRKLDEKRQRALSRYYLDSGVGGLAVGVHTTQFEIRKPDVNLFKPVLELAKEEIDNYALKSDRPIIRIAGVIGDTNQALKEAELAAGLGYQAVLLSLASLPDASNKELLDHCRAVSEVIPIIGFYMQTAVGGRYLDFDFWYEFAQIENVVAIKMAPFNRYQTFDVARAVVESGRAEQIALYTGNDDNILVDLMTEFQIQSNGEVIKKKIVGGLLGHWSVWAKEAVTLLADIKKGTYSNDSGKLLTMAAKITDSNAAFFDAANNFSGCIVGLHEVLRRQGLLEGIWTLNEKDSLSVKQKAEIDRVYKAYPELNDDHFVSENVAAWLK
ncbi:dihydrodipicolinate synthase family protein [Arenibacter sp. F26102]|uniref:dihydrodipicolinate synthase family protein n=1 Tax=Arenibacter sp. F26102 TaxID=2926416 RepID=UPI001FF4E9BB|nr:dihydrodipicolinate synthase family protein [Arenibacter sp. F26102]MCK0147206.1 dihydrodipicolinate synthase family protein [Arenibacter sp. F26102]